MKIIPPHMPKPQRKVKMAPEQFGRMGGDALKASKPPDYFSKLAKKSWAKRRAKARALAAAAPKTKKH